VVDRLISADSHVTVRHEQVKQHLDPAYHDEYDVATGALQRTMGGATGKANQAGMIQFTHPAFGRPGNADPIERLKDMDTDGVDVEVLYCEVSAFRFLYKMKRGALEATRAFNDTLLEFASVDPKRLVLSYQIPIHDVPTAVAEVQRVANAGGKSLQLPVFPNELGLPEYFDPVYDPLWAAIQDTDLPICCHIGLNTGLEDLARRDPNPMKAVTHTQTALSTGEALGFWMTGGVLERFPRLKVVFVEPALGWIPFYLHSMDDKLVRRGYDFPHISEKPSFYFHRNIFVTFIEEPDVVQLLRHRIGVENMMWSSDYPHPVSSWPNSRALIDKVMDGVPEDEQALILGGNAARVWNL
jgi:predicted TIM-barrel fold metal-dependent hydrolase